MENSHIFYFLHQHCHQKLGSLQHFTLFELNIFILSPYLLQSLKVERFHIYPDSKCEIIDQFSYQFMSEKDSIRASKLDGDNPEVFYVKQMTPKRWKCFMIQILEEMSILNPKQKNLITDLITIASSVPEANFVQAALEARPFKPQFKEQPLLLGEVTESTTTSTIMRAAKFKEQKFKKIQKNLKKQMITEKTLKKQFNQDYHPYRFIIKNFSRLMELKYKQQVDMKKLKIGEVQKKLKQDLKILTIFLTQSSTPYRKIFKTENNEDEELSFKKLNKFIEGYLFEHSKLSSTCHKIMLYACKASYHQYFEKKIPNFVTPQQYDIPQDFRIDGSYINSMNSLMEFSESSNHKASMEKLIQFRSNILKDIDQYYKQKVGESQQLEVSAQIQIQIIRFIVGKLKGWSCQIYSQLKYLELMYGDEEIAYKYEQVSFMYTQLSLVFEILELQ